MVEQRTENPCVGSSILPLGTTLAEYLRNSSYTTLFNTHNLWHTENMKKFLILATLILISCSTNEDLEQVSFSQFKEDALNVKSVLIKGDLIEVETSDGRKYEVVTPILSDFAVEDVLSGLDVEIHYAPVKQPSIWSQLLIGSLPFLGAILFIFLFLAVWAAYLASNRNQSRALWFFLTLIFPIAILFIATKDRVKKK